ncbi:MAG: tryptophanase [bacterium]|jgi:tryptophanase|nr:tryptophanase [Planctomycetota bacterium]HIL51187.1 tryptophanase [Planctomycetota bacterium]
MKTIIEPFRIKSVEPIHMTSRETRERLIQEADLNLFALKSDDVIIDLLTDSGTGAMSSEQWAALMRGDESYAGSPSYQRFEAVVREVFGIKNVIPTHQGRAAEHLLFGAVGGAGKTVPGNTHFDTTRANVEASGAKAVDYCCAESLDTSSNSPFKGNMDIGRLRDCLAREGQNVPLVLVTVTNNAGGGQPVSLANLRAVRALCDEFGVPLFIDACRFAENAFLISKREDSEKGRPLEDIVHDMFRLADGCTMSAKKDGLANIGGFIAVRNGELARILRERLVVTEGFATYGGMAGRDLEAVAQGLREVLSPEYQEYRHASIQYVVERLAGIGIPVVQPAGGHAIFLDAARFLPQIPWNEFPGQALAIELYIEGGVRSCEIGSLMLAGVDPETGAEIPAERELVRLAIPRRTYTQSHMDYLLEVIEAVWLRREQIGGVEITSAPPVLRHFTGKYRRRQPAPRTAVS